MYRKGAERWIARSATWTGIFLEECPFSALQMGAKFYMLFLKLKSWTLGQVLHIISLNGEYSHPSFLSAELMAVSLGTDWLHNSHMNKRCSELLGAGSVCGVCTLRGLQADCGIQKQCSLFTSQFKAQSDCSCFLFWEQENTGVGEMECGTFVMAITVTVTLTL